MIRIAVVPPSFVQLLRVVGVPEGALRSLIFFSPLLFLFPSISPLNPVFRSIRSHSHRPPPARFTRPLSRQTVCFIEPDLANNFSTSIRSFSTHYISIRYFPYIYRTLAFANHTRTVLQASVLLVTHHVPSMRCI